MSISDYTWVEQKTNGADFKAEKMQCYDTMFSLQILLLFSTLNSRFLLSHYGATIVLIICLQSHCQLDCFLLFIGVCQIFFLTWARLISHLPFCSSLLFISFYSFGRMLKEVICYASAFQIFFQTFSTLMAIF